jgi:hypothetical protein
MLALPLQTWLQGSQHYGVGVILYNTYGKDDVLKKQLAKGCSTHNQHKLKQAVEDILSQLTTHDSRLPLYTPPADQQSEMPGSTDAVLESFRQQWLPLYKRMTYLQAQLDRYEAENTTEAINFRHTTAKEILEIEQQVTQIWQQRDYYAKHGELPMNNEQPSTTNIPDDPAERAKMILNTKKAIQRCKRSIKQKPADKKLVRWTIDLQEKEELLKKLLNERTEV